MVAYNIENCNQYNGKLVDENDRRFMLFFSLDYLLFFVNFLRT